MNYLDAVIKLLQEVRETQRDAISGGCHPG